MNVLDGLTPEETPRLSKEATGQMTTTLEKVVTRLSKQEEEEDMG